METFFEENYIITDTMIIFKPDYQRKNTIQNQYEEHNYRIPRRKNRKCAIKLRQPYW